MTVRELRQDEAERLREFPPFDVHGVPELGEHFRVVIVEEEGRIIGLCGLSTQIHWDPWFVDPAHQGKAAAFRSLIAGGLEILRECGITGVHTTVPAEREDLMELVERFGFIPAPGKLFIAHVPDIKEY